MVTAFTQCRAGLYTAFPISCGGGSFRLSPCPVFSLPSLYVQSFKYRKTCVTGCRFSLRLVYALIATWGSPHRKKKYFAVKRRSSGGGVYSFIVLSAARRLPMSRWCGGSVCLCVVLFWYAIRRPSGLPYLSRGVPVAAVFPLLDNNIP